jgi:hypothetical protein
VCLGEIPSSDDVDDSRAFNLLENSETCAWILSQKLPSQFGAFQQKDIN